MACSTWDCAGRWQTQGQWAAVFLKLWVYWFSWLAAPVLWVALCVKAAQAVRRQVWGAAGMRMLAVALVSVGLWATLIEPHQIHIRHTTLTGMPAAAGAQPLRLALVADVHWGLFFRDHQVRHLAERLNELAKVDPHPPSRFRVNCVVNHIDDFYDTYDVTKDDGLYLPPEKRAKIW